MKRKYDATVSETVRAAGLKSVNQLSEMTKVSPFTLRQWFKNRPEVFELMLNGALLKLEEEDISKNNLIQRVKAVEMARAAAHQEYLTLNRLPAHRISESDLLAMRQALNRLSEAIEKMSIDRENYEKRQEISDISPP